jgi:hypothetical protein
MAKKIEKRKKQKNKKTKKLVRVAFKPAHTSFFVFAVLCFLRYQTLYSRCRFRFCCFASFAKKSIAVFVFIV